MAVFMGVFLPVVTVKINTASARVYTAFDGEAFLPQ